MSTLHTISKKKANYPIVKKEDYTTEGDYKQAKHKRKKAIAKAKNRAKQQKATEDRSTYLMYSCHSAIASAKTKTQVKKLLEQMVDSSALTWQQKRELTNAASVWEKPAKEKTQKTPDKSLLSYHDIGTSMHREVISQKQSPIKELDTSLLKAKEAAKIQAAINTAREQGVIISTDNATKETVLTNTKGTKVAEIVYRKAQGRFRAMVLNAYNNTCLITGCRLAVVLEAAHVVPYDGNNDSVSNSLLLRSDIHKLLDTGLLCICPKTNRVLLCNSIKNEYGQYDGLIVKHLVSEENLLKAFRHF